MPEPITLAPIDQFDASTSTPDQLYLVQDADGPVVANYDDGWKDADTGDDIDDVIGFAGPFTLIAVPEAEAAPAEDGEEEAAA